VNNILIKSVPDLTWNAIESTKSDQSHDQIPHAKTLSLVSL